MSFHIWLRSAFRAARGKRIQTRRGLRFETLETRNLLYGGDVLPAAVPGEGESTPMPDFSLTDVNPASPTNEQAVSPRDYLQQVSAWYFGHST